MSKQDNNLLSIATLGRAIGLKGEMKIHFDTDFIEQFSVGKNFLLKSGNTITIKSINFSKSSVIFEEFSSREELKHLTNQKLYTTIDKSRESCLLEEDEFFWFDVIGCSVIEETLLLGVVDEIERIGIIDYLLIKTDEQLKDKPKTFLIPYQDPFIVSTDLDKKSIYVKGGFDILENS